MSQNLQTSTTKSNEVPTGQMKTIGKYSYCVTPADLEQEQQAFEPGEGVCTKIAIRIGWTL